MPLIKIKLTNDLSKECVRKLKNEIVEPVSKILNKSDDYFMLIVQPSLDMFLGKNNDSIAFIEFRNIGAIEHTKKSKILKCFSDALFSLCNIEDSNLYVNFFSFQRSDWAWKSEVL